MLNDDNAETYWERSDQFDMALDLTAGRRGLAALGTVIARWIAHLLAVEVTVEPLIEARTSILPGMSASMQKAPRSATRLWNGEDLDDAARDRIVGLYRLTLRRPGRCAGQGRGRTDLSAAGDDGRTERCA